MTTHRKIVLSVLTAAAVAGCEVTNPGPVADEFLSLPEAHQALVNGAAARLSQALGNIGITGALAAREVFPTGQTNLGFSLQVQAGTLLAVDVSSQWTNVQQARWIAEDGIRRFTALPSGKVNATTFAQAYLWAGFSNRMLGENMCDAVFDGGPKEPNIKYFERAQAAFTSALTLATGNDKSAAYAGRASVRVYLKDWAGAASDAQQVPLGFVYTLAADPTDASTRNNIAYANGNNPYRQYSGLNTWFIDYYNQTGDPRVAFTFDARYPNGVQNLPGVGQVAWWPSTKYPANNTPFRIASGREMVLVRAEALLNSNDFQGAMTLINGLRADQISKTTGKALTPWPVTNLTDAWTYLKRERGIEMYLEGRRLGDIRRWEENKTPGVLDWPNYEALSALFRDNKPSRCFPIPESEMTTNPNLK